MSIYRLDLDALEEARDKHQLSAIKVGENIDTSYGVVNKTNETVYSGEDANNFRSKFISFIDRDIVQLQETLLQMEMALSNGLDEAKGCKKICNDFIISLGGESNGKSEADMHGEFYCDQSIIGELKDACREAVSYTEPIRTEADRIKSFLDSLQMVRLDASPYTEKIKEGCDEVEKLEEHSRELDTYASTAELIDDSFKDALNGCIPLLFLGLEIGLGAGIGDLSARVETVMEIMEKNSELSELDKAVLDKNIRIMEENGEIEGLRKVAEHAGNGENEAWTEGDAYVMAQILSYAENNCNTELVFVIYNKMKMVTHISSQDDTHANSVKTMHRYEVGLDESKVSAILGELNPEKGGLAYYSLQRRSKYKEKVKKIEWGSDAKAPEIDFEIEFKITDGKLVSVFTVDSKSIEINSTDMNEVLGQNEIEQMLALGYTHEAIAIGLTPNEIKMLEVKGVHLTNNDIKNIGSTLYTDNVKLSDDRKAVFYQGKAYYINVPTGEAAFEPMWERDGEKKYSDFDFDLAAGFLGIELEGVEKEEIRTSGNEYVLQESTLDATDVNVRAASGITVFFGITSFLSNSISTTDVEMVFESADDNRRVSILVGDSKTRYKVQNCNLAIPRNLYAMNNDNVVLVHQAISDATKELYRDLTGEDVPKPKGDYTLVANLNEERKNMFYFGHLSYDNEGNMIYTPRVLPEEEMHISECGFLYGGEKEKIYDCTELLKRPTKISDNLKSVMEKAWENWGDE